MTTKAGPLLWSQIMLGLALVLVLGACARDSYDPPIAPGYVEPTPDEPVVDETPVPSDDAVESATDAVTPGPLNVRIVSATVLDMLDRTDLTLTVSDVPDAPAGQVPDVIGASETTARETIETAGFVPYFVDTFPPTGNSPRVFVTYPRAGEVHQFGASVFIEVDGPAQALVVDNGDRLSGVLNGQRFVMNVDAAIWTIPIWLDAPLAFAGSGGHVAVGREVRVFVDAGDLSCALDGSDVDTAIMMSGVQASFVLDHEPDADLFAPVGARDLLIDC